MKKIFIGFLVLLCSAVYSCVYADTIKNGIRVSNNLFTIVLPKEVRGTYSVIKNDQGILIYDKVSKKAGFGGYAFGLRIFKKPSEYASYPGSKKLGELVDRYGTVYDMVLIQPTDVQYDYVTGNSASYYRLYHLANTIGENILEKSYTKYYNGRGTRGKDLYNEIIEKHIKAIKEHWDSNKLEQENMSYMYNALAANNKNLLDKIGYAYYDVNADGIEELFIGEIEQGVMKGVIYDIYTMVDRKPVHVVSGGNRDRYFATDEVFLCNEFPSGADERVWKIFILVENSTTLYPQVFFKQVGQEDADSTWYITYSSDNGEWKKTTEQEFKDRKTVFDKYVRFDYTPLSKFKK